MALIRLFVKSAWGQACFITYLHKIILIKFFWTISDIVGYVIYGNRVVIELLRAVSKYISLIF